MMIRTSMVGISALLFFALEETPCRADVDIRAPFVWVHVGSAGCAALGGVHVRAPFVDLHIPRAARKLGPRRASAESTAPPLLINQAAATTGEALRVASPRPVTIAEFAASFHPTPGDYTVVLIHPVTQEPVAVRFTLPEGSPRQVRAWSRRLVFSYEGSAVRVRFLRDGGVRVVNR